MLAASSSIATPSVFIFLASLIRRSRSSMAASVPTATAWAARAILSSLHKHKARNVVCLCVNLPRSRLRLVVIVAPTQSYKLTISRSPIVYFGNKLFSSVRRRRSVRCIQLKVLATVTSRRTTAPPKQTRPKVEPKTARSITRIPDVLAKVAMGVELLALRAAISSKPRLQQARLNILTYNDASESIRVVRFYADRPEIVTRLSWPLLVRLSEGCRRHAARSSRPRFVAGIQSRCLRSSAPASRASPRGHFLAIGRRPRWRRGLSRQGGAPTESCNDHRDCA
jgi:hypothetical protein